MCFSLVSAAQRAITPISTILRAVTLGPGISVAYRISLCSTKESRVGHPQFNSVVMWSWTVFGQSQIVWLCGHGQFLDSHRL